MLLASETLSALGAETKVVRARRPVSGVTGSYTSQTRTT